MKQIATILLMSTICSAVHGQPKAAKIGWTRAQFVQAYKKYEVIDPAAMGRSLQLSYDAAHPHNKSSVAPIADTTELMILNIKHNGIKGYLKTKLFDDRVIESKWIASKK